MADKHIAVVYAAKPETEIRKTSSGRSKVVNKVLMGTWMGITRYSRDGERAHVITAGKDGWVKLEDTKEEQDLKIFFVDVGQGDGALIECNSKRYIVDGGPNRAIYRYLTKWQYSYALKKKEKVHIDAIFISHFDADHYKGIIPILKDERFTVDTIYHNGIARFATKAGSRKPSYNTDLGKVLKSSSFTKRELDTTFNSLTDVNKLLAGGGLQTSFKRMLTAISDAAADGRVGKVKRLTARDKNVKSMPAGLSIDVLGPITVNATGRSRFPWFTNSSHTRNGHSLVLKFNYGDRTFLLGGDLNTESEHYLLERSGAADFKVDVAKSCHHGSGDFTIKFLKALKPYATVISSGDNESYAHPRADAIGCAGLYSRGKRPLVFSTELARSYRSADDILYGLINCRCDGEKIVMAQMKESKRGADIWDSYVV